jgi:hypothetical protein
VNGHILIWAGTLISQKITGKGIEIDGMGS